MLKESFIFTYFTQFAFIASLVFCTNFSHGQTVEARIKLEVTDGDIEGTTISVLSAGQLVSTIKPNRKCVKIELNFQKEYTLRFEKSGYISKDIHIDTRNVPLHMRQELLDFAFKLELIPIIGLPIIVEDSLQMAVWKYDSDYGLFDFERIDNSLTLYKKGKDSEGGETLN